MAAAAYAHSCSSDKHADKRRLWVGLLGAHFQITVHPFSQASQELEEPHTPTAKCGERTNTALLAG